MDDTQLFIGSTGMEQDHSGFEDTGIDAPALIEDERRMHVRAYNHWVSLLDGRPYPLIDDLNPADVQDFSSNSVLLDFTSGPDDAVIAYLGSHLRGEGGIDQDIRTIAEVPPRSVLSRLTDHYLQIIANKAPIGFEAEYLNQRGRPTMYRGILMPFSSSGDSIDFIYGVINWKEVAEETVAEDIHEAVAAALADPQSSRVTTPIWADGPHARPGSGLEEIQPHPSLGFSADAALYDRLAVARESVGLLAASDQRSRAALYHALGHAYDFAVASEADASMFAEILEDAGLVAQARAPMTPIVKLVFGVDYDKTRLAEYAAVLAYGRRNELPSSSLAAFLESHDGGLKAIVKAERAYRKPAPSGDRDLRARKRFDKAEVLATIALEQGLEQGMPEGSYFSLLGRREADGTIALVNMEALDGANLIRASRTLSKTKNKPSFASPRRL